MIRLFRAFLWLRWRLLVNSVKVGGGLDRAARLSRWAQTVVKVVLPLLFVPAALGIALAAFLGGGYLVRGDNPIVVSWIARAALFVVMVVIVIGPLFRSVHGGTTGRARFLLLPIPRRALLLSEIVSSFADPWLFIMAPALVLLPAGMLVGRSVIGSMVALAAGLAMLVILASLGALASFVSHLLLRNRRRMELIAMILLSAVLVVSFLPILMSSFWDRAETEREERGPTPAFQLPAWTRALPSELYGATLYLTAKPGRAWAGLLPTAGLALTGAALVGVASWTHGRLLDMPEGGTARRGRGPLRFRTPRLPGLGPEASAVAFASAQVALRTVKGKMAVFSCPIAVFFLGFVLSRRWEGIDTRGLVIGPGVFVALVSVALPLLSLQPVLLNVFAIDRAGLSLQFLSPLSDRALVRGKIAGGALLMLACTLPSLLVGALVAGVDPLNVWILALLGAVAAYLLLAPLFAALSVILPRAADLSSLGTAGNPNQFAGMLSLPLILASFLPLPTLLLAAHFLLGNQQIALILMLVWIGVAAMASLGLTRFAAHLLGRRREQLMLLAQDR